MFKEKLTLEQAEQREQIVFNRPYDTDSYRRSGGCRRFDNMDVNTARKLIRLGYLDPNDCQNASPSAREIIDFCSDDDSDIWYLHGYVISPERGDCRITIEGCGSSARPSSDRIVAFVDMFRYADEFSIDGACYCWYD